VLADFALTPGTTPGQLAYGDIRILWHAAPSAPVSVHADAGGCALVIGDAIRPGQSRRVDARGILQDWLEPAGASPAVYDGFHVAIAVRGAELALGGDLLGLAPIVHAAPGPVRLAGSSSAHFCLHPLFHDRLDVRGLFGHLLTGGPFDGRTLRAGVTRMGAGRLLRWSGGAPPQERSHYNASGVDSDGMRDFDAALQRYDAALHAAVRRHSAVHAHVSILLSGGRDSRLLGGYVLRDRRLQQAFTLGAPSDHDAMCAASVARTLRTSHRTHDVPFASFLRHADRSISAELLSGGMSNVHTWEGADALAGTEGGLLSGYLLEARQIAPMPPTVAGVLDWTHAHAMTPARLRRLVRPHLRPLVDETTEAIERAAHALGTEESSNERSWRWVLATYARFHPGAVPWRYSSAAWPILPILDQGFLQTMQAMPPAWLDSRRMQDAVLCRRFPRLARLPLDRNGSDVRPLLSSPLHRLREALERTLGARRAPTVERRFYARMYDFDNSGWRQIRAAAEPGRARMAEWFDLAALALVLPTADQSGALADPIAEGFGPKMLTGFMRALSTGVIRA
jgi:asparagine synthase (glutamine-hydrolysing)